MLRLCPEDLSDTRVHVDADGARIAGHPLDSLAILDRPAHGWGTGFIAEDESFAAQEWAATWLTVLWHPAVTVLSRPPATVWYSPTEWQAWRDLLQGAGIDVLPIAVATPADDEERTWLSWVGGQGRPPDAHAARALMAATIAAQTLTNVYFAGATLVPPTEGAPLQGAVDVLANHGVRFGRLTCEGTGVIAFSAWPTIPDNVIPILAPACAEVLHGRPGAG